MPGPETPPPRSRGRRRLRLLGVIAGGAVLLLLLLVAALHTPPVKRYVLSRVTSLLADSQIAFTAQRLDYNLFNLSLVLQNVTLRAVGAEAAPAFAHIDRATVDMSLLALPGLIITGAFSQRSVVADTRLDAPVIGVFIQTEEIRKGRRDGRRAGRHPRFGGPRRHSSRQRLARGQRLPSSFVTMGIPLRQDRDFTSSDVRGASGVVIINERAAPTFWPGENPFGRQVRVGGPNPLKIVGIVGRTCTSRSVRRGTRVSRSMIEGGRELDGHGERSQPCA